MATATYFIRKGKKGAAIYVKYRHGEKDKAFNTGVKIEASQWNDSKNRIDSTRYIKKIKANEKLINELSAKDKVDNLTIKTFKAKIEAIARKLDIDGIEPTVKNLSNAMYPQKVKQAVPKPTKINLIAEFNIFRENIKNDLSHSTWKGYVVTQNHLMKHFANRKKLKLPDSPQWQKLDYTLRQKIDIDLNDFKLKEINEFKRYLKIKAKLSDASIKKNLDRIKRFLKVKFKEGDYNSIEYRDIEMPKVDYFQEDIVYLTSDELRQLRALELKRFSRLDKVRDVFLMACSTGLRFSDVMRLKKERIKNDVIHIKAEKTNKKLEIPLFLFAPEIFEKYEYQLPVISNQKMNEYVKELLQMAEINSPVLLDYWQGKKLDGKVFEKWQLVSSHSGKKTFVMLNIEAGTPIEVLAEMTGNTLDSLKHYYRITLGKKKKHLEAVERAFMESSS